MSEAKPRYFPRLSNAPINDDVATAPALFDALNRLFHFTYDPAPLNGATREGVPDGLATPLGALTFCNPPYSEAHKWLAHMATQWELYGARSVVLVPHHAETQYWHDSVVYRASQVWQCVTGLRFHGYDKKFAMPMCVVLYGDWSDCTGELHTGSSLLLGDNHWTVYVLHAGEILRRQRRRVLGWVAEPGHVEG